MSTATRSDPPRVPDDTRVYAIGDLHGRADLLARLHARIRDDADGAPGRRVVVYMGDYVDRGPQSFEVVDMILHDPPPGCRTVRLKGNHEDFLLCFLDGDDVGSMWLMNGGEATLRSYGIETPSEAWGLVSADPGELAVLRTRLAEAMPTDHLRLLRDLSLSHVEGDYLFVHAGVRPGVALADQTPHDLMWIRDEFLSAAAPCDRIVVHGHTIESAPVTTPWRIGIDTGAYRSGRLTCLVLEGAERRFLTA